MHQPQQNVTDETLQVETFFFLKNKKVVLDDDDDDDDDDDADADD